MDDDVTVKPPIDPMYLGDGVYGSFDGWQIKLRASGNTVYIQPKVWDALQLFAKRCWPAVQSAAAADRPDE